MPNGYLIRNGELHDGHGRVIHADVRIVGDTITQIGPDLQTDRETVIDAAGLIVCPGLIDLHVHCYHGLGIFSIDPADCGLRRGVTTMLDTGSAGWLNYGPFDQYVIPAAAEDIYTLLHVSGIGCHGNQHDPPYFGELIEPRFISADRAVRCINEYPARILGTKARLTASLADNKREHELAAMRAAIEAAERTDRFCMFHHKDSNIAIDEVLAVMRPGDIYTHMYHPGDTSPFPDGKPTDATIDARNRGIIFDVAHGVGSFGWRVAESVCHDHDFWPNTISTDVHQFNIAGPVYDMTTTMTKFLHLDMPLPDVITASTSAPAAAMRLGDRFGTLAEGRQADVTLLRIESGSFELHDILGESRTASQRLVPVHTLKRGTMHTCS
jgi:dihydroorotase